MWPNYDEREEMCVSGVLMKQGEHVAKANGYITALQ